jgi:hypothetical protein
LELLIFQDIESMIVHVLDDMRAMAPIFHHARAHSGFARQDGSDEDGARLVDRYKPVEAKR